MDLKRVIIKLAADGFRIIDKGAGLQHGEILNIQYESGGTWTTKQIGFEREAPTFFHPFRKCMFVYTGARPTRVLIRAMDGGFTDDLDTGAITTQGADYRRSYYQRSNFHSYPDFDDDVWDSSDYRHFFPSHSSHPTISHTSPDESASGSIGTSSFATEVSPSAPPPPPPPPPPPAPEPASALDLNAPLERDSREDETASGSIGETPVSLDPSPALERESTPSDSGPSDSGASGAVGLESSSSEPNAY